MFRAEGIYLQVYTASQPRTTTTSPPPLKSQISHKQLKLQADFSSDVTLSFKINRLSFLD
jgi:hypothetical protein